MVTLVDMRMGNLGSVCHAFERVGLEVSVTSTRADVERATTLVLPGVGAFGDGMAALRADGLIEPIRRHVLEKKLPLMGICVGMQLLADEGEEHGVNTGLGLVRGR